jgi:hypothetical protein
MQALEPFYDKLDPAFLNVRKVVREVLQKEEDLNEIVQLVGKVGCPARCLPISGWHATAVPALYHPDCRFTVVRHLLCNCRTHWQRQTRSPWRQRAI